MSYLHLFKKGDVLYCGPDRVSPGGSYSITYEPNDRKDKFECWADATIKEYLELLGFQTQLHYDERFSAHGDLLISRAAFLDGRQEMHPAAQQIFDSWKCKTNRVARYVLLHD